MLRDRSQLRADQYKRSYDRKLQMMCLGLLRHLLFIGTIVTLTPHKKTPLYRHDLAFGTALEVEVLRKGLQTRQLSHSRLQCLHLLQHLLPDTTKIYVDEYCICV